jgi:hypothetical protein
MIRRRPDMHKDVAVAISGVDQRIRDALQNLWLSLPRDEATIENLEKHFLRLAHRALSDLKEDMNYFPPKFNETDQRSKSNL